MEGDLLSCERLGEVIGAAAEKPAVVVQDAASGPAGRQQGNDGSGLVEHLVPTPGEVGGAGGVLSKARERSSSSV